MGILLKGVPHGLAFLKYNDPRDKYLSFCGMGIFNQGILHNSPFICVNKYGVG
jgi:hypothetical protein